MAANSYYNANIPLVHEQQQHLLAHTTPPIGHDPKQPMPLKPLHLVEQTNYHYGHGATDDNGDIKQAQKEDAVRLY
jgi:hypothetical protein